MKTCRWPSPDLHGERRLDHLARLAAAHLCLRRVACSLRVASATRGANGSTSCSTSASAGSTSGSDDSGRRRPSGESPPTAYRRSRRSGHGLDSHATDGLPRLRPRQPSAAARSPPACRARLQQDRARRARSPGSARSALSGSTFTGSAASSSTSLGHVFVRGDHAATPAGRALARAGGVKSSACAITVAPSVARVGDQRGVAPQRLAVDAPVHADGPARQRLARIPLALPVVHEAAGREAVLEPQQQRFGQLALLGAERGGVPLDAFHVVDRHEGRLAALREPTSCAARSASTCSPSASMAAHCASLYGLVTRGSSCTRVTLIATLNSTLRDVGEADHRRGVAGVGGAGERNVALAGEQSRRRVEPDPAGAGQVDLGPGVQVGEVRLRTRWAVERLHVGDELDQVARREARREAEMPQDLHQQPARVAARSAARWPAFPRASARPAPCAPGSVISCCSCWLSRTSISDGALVGADRGPEALHPVAQAAVRAAAVSRNGLQLLAPAPARR